MGLIKLYIIIKKNFYDWDLMSDDLVIIIKYLEKKYWYFRSVGNVNL